MISDFLVAILEKEKGTGEINMNDVFYLTQYIHQIAILISNMR